MFCGTSKVHVEAMEEPVGRNVIIKRFGEGLGLQLRLLVID